MFDFFKNFFSLFTKFYFLYYISFITFTVIFKYKIYKIRDKEKTEQTLENKMFELEVERENTEEKFCEYKEFKINQIKKELIQANRLYYFIILGVPIITVFINLILYWLKEINEGNVTNNILTILFFEILYILNFNIYKKDLDILNIKYELKKINEKKLFKKLNFIDKLLYGNSKDRVISNLIFITGIFLGFLLYFLGFNKEFYMYLFLISSVIIVFGFIKISSYKVYKKYILGKDINIILMSELLRNHYYPSKYNKEFDEALGYFYNNDNNFKEKFDKKEFFMEQTYYELLENKKFKEKVLEKIKNKEVIE